MVEKTRAEFDIDAVGRVREQIGPQDAENGLENRDRQQTNDQHVECAQAAVHQHLVDDHLKEQWRDKGEHLQKERRDQHLAQKMPIFVDRSHKPGDVEAAGDLRQSGPARHQDQSAVPDREKLGPRHQSGPGRQWRLHQNLVLAGLGDHEESAIAQNCDGGQGRIGKPRPIGPVAFRLEPELLGAPEHLRCANLCCSEPMSDLFAISRDALQMQQRHERLEPRIGWCRAVCFSAHLRSPGLDVASSVRLRQQRLLGRWLLGNRRRTVTIARRREARCHELAEQRGSVRAVACRRGVSGVVAVHRGDCDGLAIGDFDDLVINEETIGVFLEVGDRHSAVQT